MREEPIGPGDFAKLQVYVNSTNIIAATRQALATLPPGKPWEQLWTAPSEAAAKSLADAVQNGLVRVLRRKSAERAYTLVVGTAFRPAADNGEEWRVYIGFRPEPGQGAP